MNRLDLKIKKAAKRKCFAFQAFFVDGQPWCVYIDGEWGPRGYFTKREAANLAYHTSLRKEVKLKVKAW